MSIIIPVSVYRELVVMLGKSGLIHLEGEVADDSATSQNIINSTGLAAYAGAAEKIVASATEFISNTNSCSSADPDYDSILEDIPSLFSRDYGMDLYEINHINRKREQYFKVRANIEKEIEFAKFRLNEIRILDQSGIDLSAMQRMKYLSYVYGVISGTDSLNKISDRWFYIRNENRFLFIFSASERYKFLNALKEDGFVELHGFEKSGQSLESARVSTINRIIDLNRRLNRLDDYFYEQLKIWTGKMSYLIAVYTVILKIATAESSLRFSEEIILISGWIDLRNAESIKGLLLDTCGDRFYIKIATSSENRKFRGRIPVIMRNIPLFRPFELLVKIMGFPGNSEVDPTPAAALVYVVIFGVMFGDAGQGLVIALTGFFINRYGKKKFGERNNISDFGIIMIWCGISAVIFGFLYGSVFSYEHLLPALLFHPMENMMQLFLMVIMMGVVFISSGLALNIINGIISGHYGESLFGTKGGAGLVVYISSIFFVFRYILTKAPPDTLELSAAIVIPAFLFALRGPLEYILFHGEEIFPDGLFEYTVESVVEVIEMFSGFLGNTVSFIRAGAFALSHAGLSIAVFTLAGIVDPSLNSPGALIVIIAGNIFIIILEGLICAIQSMRLEYYEFFGKFFKGDGVGFAPFLLRFK